MDYLQAAENLSTGDLFDWAESLSRPSDPVTSAIAADKIAVKLSNLRAQFVAGVRRCGGSATAKEAAVAMSTNPEVVESIRKRAKECVDAGFVQLLEPRKCRVSGNSCLVYVVDNKESNTQ